MKTAEEYIKKSYPFYDPYIVGRDVELNGEQVAVLINEARKDAIMECAEKVLLQKITYDCFGGILDVDTVGNEIPIEKTERTSTYVYVDEDSILSLIDELK